ncbi:ribosome maturation factor RimM [Sodalis-like secondary symbiont of Drepanosiphum platanoidis]|uniref:ribosome maturation factor RimM n=1 Tax=Sodalis-like secondary symbiont of Drepanosiphum platanoidis TaxID=2994493 RepID=UPI003464407D
MINKPIIIGKIGSVYGTKGLIKIFSFMENKKNIFNFKKIWIKKINKWNELLIKFWQIKNNNFFILIKDINSREKASILTNNYIYISKNQLPILKKNNFYWYDLINFNVINSSGYNFGKIFNIINTGSNDILIIKKNKKFSYNKEILIPFIEKDVIKEVNIKLKKIFVKWEKNY